VKSPLIWVFSVLVNLQDRPTRRPVLKKKLTPQYDGEADRGDSTAQGESTHSAEHKAHKKPQLDSVEL
jgi:hypothetical protein